MPRNRGLATAVLILACGLGLLWRFSTQGNRGGLASRTEAAAESTAPEPGPLDTAVDAAAGTPKAAPRDRATLEVSTGLATPGETGAFEADAVYGRVVDPDGEPVPGTTVLLFEGDRPLEQQDAPLAEASTDEDGRYRFRELDVFLGYQLYFEAEGFLPRLGRNSPGHDDETELARCISIAGRVLDARTDGPLASVEVRNDVRHWSEDGYREYAVASSDEDGGYSMPWARLEGMQRLRLRRPRHTFEDREFQVDAKKSEGYDLRLGPGREVLVEVYDFETGVPLPDMELELSEGYEVRTDGAGRIDLVSVLQPGARDRRISLSLTAPGWCRTNVTFGLQAEGAAQLVRVPVTRGAKLRGSVVDTDGNPVGDALVRFGNQRNRFRRRAPTRPDLPPNVWIGHAEEPAFSAVDGSFEITGLFQDQQTLRVTASHPRYERATVDDVQLTPTTTELEVELVLGTGCVIQGLVTVDGEPTSTNVNWNADENRGWTRSNDRGEYRFRNVSAGEVRLSATLDDKSWSNRESEPEVVWLEPGQTLEHDIVITSNRAVIAGTVRDSTGEPVANAEVIAWASVDENFHFSTSTNADDSGAWEVLVEAVPGVLYQLYARDGPRYQLVDGVAPGTTGIEIELPELGELRLAVQDATSGEPIEGFSVYWRFADEGSYRRLQQGSSTYSPGPDGTFVAELAVGTLDLFVGAKDLGYSAVRLPRVRVDAAASDRPVPVLLERGVTVDLVFEYEEGTRELFWPALRRRRLALVSEEQARLQELGGEYFDREVRYGQALRVNDAGNATVQALAPGEYTVFPTPEGLAFEPEKLDVPLVDRHRVEIRVKKVEKAQEEGG